MDELLDRMTAGLSEKGYVGEIHDLVLGIVRRVAKLPQSNSEMEDATRRVQFLLTSAAAINRSEAFHLPPVTREEIAAEVRRQIETADG